MKGIHAILPDGSVKEFPEGTRVEEVALDVGPGLGKAALGAKLDGRLMGLSDQLEWGGHLRILTFADEEGRGIYRHSVAHVLAQAVKRLFPQAKLGIGPAIEEGFYYDFDLGGETFSPDDLQRIEEEMGRIVKQDIPLERLLVSREEADELFTRLGEPYKLELLEGLEGDEEITCYRQGEFIDLCVGPHLPSTGRVRSFKLLHVAGAYWRGDEKRPMLQRIYGTAFEEEAELSAYLARLEEAKRRDHRRLGKELDLYSIHEEGGAGLVFWHPKGAIVRELIEDFWRAEHRRRGYDVVYSPHIAKASLWEKSGHLEAFSEYMYSPIDLDGVDYLLKPMNCPFHILMYKTQTRSYRDLPLRWAELGTVYRYERSGVLHGLLRVRGFTQDDAHIFCRQDQFEDELVGVVELARDMMKTFGYTGYDIALSVRDPGTPEKYIGAPAVWERAERALANALDRMALDYAVDTGEAKFYGPAIDIKVKDALGRGWQGPTIQLDFNLPERWDLSFVGEDGREHRPVMIHRTVLGSMERFFGGLIEHYAGAFPTWLAPVQVRVLPITDAHLDYAEQVKRELAERGLRAEIDGRNEKVGYKIRGAQMEKVPYMLIVGDREIENQTVAVRTREEGDLGPKPLSDFADRVVREVETRAYRTPEAGR